jgi:murein DD-endopeptidase MepM/ murein hydrolase activator NlpD
MNENRNLRLNVQNLTDEKKTLSESNNEKSSQIDSLKQKEEEFNIRIKDYVNKYKEITDTYISGKTSRSGDRNDRSFVSDISELKVILDNMDQSANIDVKEGDMTEVDGKLKEYIASIPTVWPVNGRVSTNFGNDKDPFKYTTRFHSGIDIAADYGVDIKASGNGKVIFSGYKVAYGYVVFIDHGHDLVTVYGHASRLLVKEGQEVNKGDVIAKVGSSGRSTGPHLHFEVRIDDTVVDPIKYLDSK